VPSPPNRPGDKLGLASLFGLVIRGQSYSSLGMAVKSTALMEFLDDAERLGAESPDSFDLTDPSPVTHDLFVGKAAFKGGTRWIICRRQAKHTYVGRGDRRQYVDCCYFGCPELVRQDCILSREDVLAFAELLPSIEQLSEPWHWVSFDQMYG
jgi:hypothetical protein